MQDYRKLLVWEKSHVLTVQIYNITEKFPSEEKFGIVSQIRRASVSIPTNMAEGCGRDSKKELTRFLQISLGSTCELEYLILLSKELKYLSVSDSDKISSDIEQIKKMLTNLIKRTKGSNFD